MEKLVFHSIFFTILNLFQKWGGGGGARLYFEQNVHIYIVRYIYIYIWAIFLLLYNFCGSTSQNCFKFGDAVKHKKLSSQKNFQPPPFPPSPVVPIRSYNTLPIELAFFIRQYQLKKISILLGFLIKIHLY